MYLLPPSVLQEEEEEEEEDYDEHAPKKPRNTFVIEEAGKLGVH